MNWTQQVTHFSNIFAIPSAWGQAAWGQARVKPGRALVEPRVKPLRGLSLVSFSPRQLLRVLFSTVQCSLSTVYSLLPQGGRGPSLLVLDT